MPRPSFLRTGLPMLGFMVLGSVGLAKVRNISNYELCGTCIVMVEQCNGELRRWLQGITWHPHHARGTKWMVDTTMHKLLVGV
jgi:hypothetical protein